MGVERTSPPSVSVSLRPRTGAPSPATANTRGDLPVEAETQVFITATSGVNPFKIPFLKKGAAVKVVGSSGQFLSQYEVLPRHRGDVKPAVP